MELAAFLYGSGAAHTQQEAAEMAGLSSAQNFHMNRGRGLPVDQAVQEANEQVKRQALSTHALLTQLGREAIEHIATVMREGQKEDNRLRAARDLADRSADTSKIHRSLNVGVSMGREDARALVEAMAESRSIRETAGTGELNNVVQSIPDADLAGSRPHFTFRVEEDQDAEGVQRPTSAQAEPTE